jgi:type I restriction enzyme S subunit
MLVIRGTDFADVRVGDISSVPLRHIPRRIADRKALAADDLLIETAGGTKDQPTGRTVLLKERLFTQSQYRVTCASFSRFLRVKRNLIRPDFLFWYLQNLYGQGELYPFHVQHTGVARFQYTQFATSVRITTPSPSEQGAIAETLNALDNKIELNRRMNETLEAMARAIFQDWFVDFGPTRAKMEGRQPYLASEQWSVFPDVLDGEEKPAGWHQGTLSDLSRLNPEVWTGRTAPAVIEYVDLSNTKWGEIELTQSFAWVDAPSRAQRVMKPGDTLVGTVRPGNGSYALVGADGLTGSTGFAVLRPKRPEYREIVYLAATAKDTIETLSHLADGAAYPAVRPEVVAARPMILPAEDCLLGFSRVTGPLLDLMQANREENQTLTQTRDLLLPKLMSGEIRVKEAEKIMAEVA